MLDSFLVPPRVPEGSIQREPKSITEELREEAALVRESAISDIILFSVENAVNGSDIDIRKAINIRHGFMKWTEVDRLIAEARPLIGPAIERAKSQRDKAEQERVKLEHLAALFAVFGLQVQPSDGGFALTGLTEAQLRLIADILTGADE